jgi:hypothetical protein
MNNVLFVLSHGFFPWLFVFLCAGQLLTERVTVEKQQIAETLFFTITYYKAVFMETIGLARFTVAGFGYFSG